MATDPPSTPRDHWDQGRLRHLLPTVSDSRLRIKASFDTALTLVAAPPSRRSARRWTDDRYHGGVLGIRRRWSGGGSALYAFARGAGKALCEPWTLATFPRPDAPVERCRVLFFACAGGHESLGYLPTSCVIVCCVGRSHISLRPWLRTATTSIGISAQKIGLGLPTGASPGLSKSPASSTALPRCSAIEMRGSQARGGPQIVPVYGVDFRSTPVFFVQDDHDYFDNDKANEKIVTFPPSWFMLQLARATQALYYPEFLPDAQRPAGLPWTSTYPTPAVYPRVSAPFVTAISRRFCCTTRAVH